MFKYKDAWEIICMVTVFTLCAAFLFWVSVATVRWLGQADNPHRPSTLETAVTACKENGGVPIVKPIVEHTTNQGDYLQACDYKDVPQSTEPSVQ